MTTKLLAHNTRYVHWLADVYSAVFAPANRQMRIGSVVGGHAKKTHTPI